MPKKRRAKKLKIPSIKVDWNKAFDVSYRLGWRKGDPEDVTKGNK